MAVADMSKQRLIPLNNTNRVFFKEFKNSSFFTRNITDRTESLHVTVTYVGYNANRWQYMRCKGRHFSSFANAHFKDRSLMVLLHTQHDQRKAYFCIVIARRNKKSYSLCRHYASQQFFRRTFSNGSGDT